MVCDGAQHQSTVQFVEMRAGRAAGHLSDAWWLIIFRTVRKRGFEGPSKFKDTVKMETFFVVGGAKEGKNIMRRREFFETLLTVGCA